MLLLVLAAIVPLIMVQAGTLSAWYYSRLAEERQATEEEARAVAAAFGAYVRDVRRESLAMGAALAGLGPFTPEQINRFLSLAGSGNPVVRSWHWIAPGGKVLASSEPNASGLDVADRDYFKELLAGLEWTTSNLLVERATGRPAFVVARQVPDPHGGLLGVLAAVVDPVVVGDRAMPLPRDPHFSFVIIDLAGSVVCSSRGEEDDRFDWDRIDSFLAAAPSGGEEQPAALVVASGGEKALVARVPIAGIGWVAGASQPVRLAIAEVYRGIWIVVALNLAVVGASGVVVLRTSRKVVRQLRHLQTQAETVGRGEAARPAEAGGIRELMDLAAAFDQMGVNLRQARDDLQQANADLERHVRERTAQLAAAVESLRGEVEERQRAEQSLREQSGVLDAFFAHTFTSLVILDREFNFIRVNEAYAGACRRDVSEFPGRNHFEFYPNAENEAIFHEVVRSKSPYRATAKAFVFPDDPERGVTYWDWNLNPILDATGEVEFLVFSLQDVTERKEAERRDAVTRQLLELFARKESRQEYFDGVVEAIREWSGCRCVGIRVADERRNIPYESHVGFTPEFLDLENGLSLERDPCLCVRAVLQTPEPQDRVILTSGGSFRCERTGEFVGGLRPEARARYRGNCTRAGFNSLAIIPVFYRGQALGAIHLADEREAAAPLACVEFLESMAPLIGEAIQRFNVERQLRGASLYARSLLEASLDPLVTISPEGRIMDVNKATELATGIDRAGLIGTDFSSYFTDPERASAGYREVLACGLTTDYPLTIRHASGRTTDVLYNAAVFRNETGEVQGVFAAARDITRRKRAEEELEVYRRHLEELVAQRTEELRVANEQLQEEIAERKQAGEVLRRTAEELARSNQELEQFAYVASHDLQEPLRVVTGYVQLIERRFKGQLDADADQFIDYIVDGASRMRQLITDLLNYSRVGTRGAAMSPTAVEAVLGRVLADLREVIAESGAAVTHDPLPNVLADEMQLAQLFQNLIGNAIKFRSERRPEIHVSASRDGDGWLFSVRDNGIGIEKQYRDQVFVIFQRLHTRQKYPGTGIGLAICKRIVERHGGRIWLDSTPGQGTTFHFTLG